MINCRIRVDPRKAVERFVAVLKDYRITAVIGDNYAGETFKRDFENSGIAYYVSELRKSQLYETLEPRLNPREVVLLEPPTLLTQLVELLWRGVRSTILPANMTITRMPQQARSRLRLKLSVSITTKRSSNRTRRACSGCGNQYCL